jgi:hypothetical protein
MPQVFDFKVAPITALLRVMSTHPNAKNKALALENAVSIHLRDGVRFIFWSSNFVVLFSSSQVLVLSVSVRQGNRGIACSGPRLVEFSAITQGLHHILCITCARQHSEFSHVTCAGSIGVGLSHRSQF